MPRNMALTYQILSPQEQKDSRQRDLAYWRSQPYSARLAALEEIRREYHQWAHGAEPRLQRVYRMIKR